jgi:hypothetical protein
MTTNVPQWRLVIHGVIRNLTHHVVLGLVMAFLFLIRRSFLGSLMPFPFVHPSHSSGNPILVIHGICFRFSGGLVLNWCILPAMHNSPGHVGEMNAHNMAWQRLHVCETIDVQCIHTIFNGENGSF